MAGERPVRVTSPPPAASSILRESRLGKGRSERCERLLGLPEPVVVLGNYLLQSVICVPLFYDFGGGWFAELSLGRLMLFSLGLFACQVMFSALWLAAFRQGPVEWLWRWQIKGERPPLLMRAEASACGS